MQRLNDISKERIRRVPMKFFRFLMDEINWDDRLIGISGARGSGKTTLMMQYMKRTYGIKSEALYVSLDDIYFAENHLVYFAEDFVKNGGNFLFLDEVPKYPNWSQELKNVYDNLPELKIVFTSSSALDIYKGGYDLSRRAIVYHLPGLSFREFLNLKYTRGILSLSLEEILQGDTDMVYDDLGDIRPLKAFTEYLEYGYYPFFLESSVNYQQRLLATINLVTETDLPSIFHLDYYSVQKIKKMLSIIARIAPYKPNIQKLAGQTGTTRDTLLKYLFYLEKAQVVKWLSRDTFGINYLNKPDKLYLNNTNLMHAIGTANPDIGNLRETFFLNQLTVKHKVSYPDKGDFMVDNKFLFEIGGPGKTTKQIAGLQDAFVASDGIEYVLRNKIPLWMFGFLY